jgi:hypothetical protein
MAQPGIAILQEAGSIATSGDCAQKIQALLYSCPGQTCSDEKGSPSHLAQPKKSVILHHAPIDLFTAAA